MSGHSKFANIKHKKEKNDAAKGKIFTKIGRELAVAVKEGGGADPANNSRLRDVIAKAKSNNMPNDTIERNIKKAAGEGSADNYEHITYEGYGPNGTAIIVKTLTDNKNRTASNVRNAFTKGSGNVGTPGCVSFMFDQKGQIVIDKEASTVYITDKEVSLDVGGVAKGFACEKVAQKLSEAGLEYGAVNAGGNQRIINTKPDGSGFNVGIQNPRAESIAGMITSSNVVVLPDLKNVSVVTSASREYHFSSSSSSL